MPCLPNLHAQTPGRRVFSFGGGLAYEAECDYMVGTEYVLLPLLLPFHRLECGRSG